MFHFFSHYNGSSRDGYTLNGHNQLNVILEPLKTQQFASKICGSSIVSWLFIFNFNVNVSEPFLESFLSNYFKSFTKIALNSRIYIFCYSEMVLMFEVFRKTPDLNMTISHLCSFNQTSNAVVFLNKNDALVRRKDLTGIHLKIGYQPNLSFFNEDEKQAIKIF
jgi:hypothetical protein